MSNSAYIRENIKRFPDLVVGADRFTSFGLGPAGTNLWMYTGGDYMLVGFADAQSRVRVILTKDPEATDD